MKFAFVAAAAAATTISLPQEIMDELQGNIQELVQEKIESGELVLDDLMDGEEAISHSTHEQGNGVGNNHVRLANAAGFHLKLEGDLYLRVGV